MSENLLIYGDSGSGKTHSVQFLDPKETIIIDADKKGLNWKGWKKIYNKENKNYIKTSDVEVIMDTLNKINSKEELKHIKTVVIDTINGIMLDAEMERMKDKGYDKWAELSQSVYGLVSSSLTLRADLIVIFIGHSENVGDEITAEWRLKTSGRKLNKIVLESKFTTVLFCKAQGDNYFFETKSNFSTAKSPFGMFEEVKIPNNLKVVVDKIREYNEFEF